MTRLWASLLTVIIYLLSQFLPAVIVNTTQFAQYSDFEQQKAGIYIKLVLFLIAATTIIFINFKIKDPTRLESEVKEPNKYIIPWALLGFALVM
ncbi:CPBP family intramembrane glutamate endopeptidase, partial [Staphylococcus aureus]